MKKPSKKSAVVVAIRSVARDKLVEITGGVEGHSTITSNKDGIDVRA